ncbi:MAG: hypothetical protein MZU97_19225 [Bacillus subtilis]|nr:hypothetical protein [Bacillus subtilis]
MFKDSIVNPKGLLEYRNKSGGFAFLYYLIMVFLMSINAIVFLFGYPAQSTITSESTGCAFVADQISLRTVRHRPRNHRLWHSRLFFQR